ncbi:hypothetical protein Pmob_1387 [Petrotoga mobilis SJ95]|jgi:hypothetical protein|uniref:Uncharacterized protein n=1 Tax=Petrotoga mobilis (strain DSM 10674 / SJ95) TaxID=403833 RepID=A9BHX6_PETMO|nr:MULTISPECIES: hypothetical protein [Petrotoga]ABX32091.1 hypothetical protein Pmob_1387 [Petrotoga mobilis SJ95]RLL85352.1 hypothetical protein BZ25_03370 [Petrotoga sp. Shatin.DS.tank11.9.2.9.3]RLL88956.1 hypothetical protein CN13_06990 [Petrotoga sp. HKA.pet.4.5]
MQVSLDQLLQALMIRLESLEISLEDLKFRTNVALRLIKKNDLLDEDKVKESVKEELSALNELSEDKMDLSDERIEEISKGIVQWIDNDLDSLRERMADYQEKMKQLLEQEEAEGNISIAPPELLNQLERAGIAKNQKEKGKNRGNIIMP